VTDGTAYLVIAAALALAVLGGVQTARNRAPGLLLFGGAAAVAALITVQGVAAVVRLIGGADVDGWLFIGYLLTAVVLLPAAAYLANLEPTRWGSAIIGAGGLVLAPLTLRLLQIWTAGGG
jgi:hypothetical protein